MDGELMEIDDPTFKLAKLQIDRRRKHQGHSRSPDGCRSLAGDFPSEMSPPLWKDYPMIRRPESPTSYSCCDGFHPGRTFNSAYHPSSVASIFGGAGRTNKSLISPPKFFGSSSHLSFQSPSEFQSYNPRSFMVQHPPSSFSAAFYHHQMSTPFSHQSQQGDIFFQSPMCRSYSQSSGFISTASITTNSHSGSERNSNDSPPSSASELINPLPKRRHRERKEIEKVSEVEEYEEDEEEEPNNKYHSFRAPLAISLFLNIILFFWLFFAPIENQLVMLDQVCEWVTLTFNFLNLDIANCNFSLRLNET